jgi:2-dehydro-3-deoxygluconokinase
MTSLLTFGECLGLLTTDGIGTLDVASRGTLGIGGAEGNVAIGAARLGTPVCWIGRVGDDAFGALVTKRLRAEGVDTVAIPDPSFTGLMVRHRRTGSVTHVDYHRRGSAGSRLSPADIPEQRVRAAGLLHVTGITPALGPSARAAVFAAVEVARAARVPISLDVNHRSKLWSAAEAAPVLRDLAGRVDLIFAGVQEAALLVDEVGPADGPARLARALTRFGAAEVVVKDGPRGAHAVLDGVAHHQPAVAVSVVDPVGAGDAFVAGYCAERLAGRPAAERLGTAAAAGGYAVTVPGDCELLPTRAELRTLTVPSEDVLR